MKKLLLILFLWVGPSFAGELYLQWEPVSGTVDGYTVYCVSKTDGTNQHKDTTNITMFLSEFTLIPGDYEFFVTAFNAMGEGEASNIAHHKIKKYTGKVDSIAQITLEIPGTATLTLNMVEDHD